MTMRSPLARLGLPGFALLVLLPAAAGAQDGPPRLALPLECRLGEDCFIQNHVDTDPAPGFRDYACGSLGYDGDTGTDFRLPSLAALRRGVPVVAAAAGTVKGVRDGMPDTGLPPGGAAALQGRLAGNGVVLDHGGGWETQYSHLRQGSVAVKPGDRVEAGQRLGLVGLSGNTQFPHVEMIVRKDGVPLDPFLGPAGFRGCGGPRDPLWRPELAERLAYRPTGVLQAGFATRPLDEAAVRDGSFGQEAIAGEPEMLLVWMELFGLRAGDRIRLRVTGPEGQVLFQAMTDQPRNQAVRIFAGPVRRPPTGYPRGRYGGEIAVLRGGDVVATAFPAFRRD